MSLRFSVGRKTQMTVYIEYVLIDNFVIDYLLLKATFLLTKTDYKNYRLILTALFGAVIALLYPLVNINALFLAALKIAVGVFLLFISNRFYSAKRVYINFLVFLSLTFLTGGAIIGVYNILGLSYDTELSVAVIVVTFYILYRVFFSVIKYLYSKKSRIRVTFPCEMILEEKTVKVGGFLDTGNALTHNGKGVIICDKKTFARIMDVKMPKIFTLQCSTVSGENRLFAFKIQKLKIYIGDEPNIFYNVTVAVGNIKAGDGYDINLHTDFVGENYVDKDSGEIKTAC